MPLGTTMNISSHHFMPPWTPLPLGPTQFSAASSRKTPSTGLVLHSPAPTPPRSLLYAETSHLGVTIWPCHLHPLCRPLLFTSHQTSRPTPSRSPPLPHAHVHLTALSRAFCM